MGEFGNLEGFWRFEATEDFNKRYLSISGKDVTKSRSEHLFLVYNQYDSIISTTLSP